MHYCLLPLKRKQIRAIKVKQLFVSTNFKKMNLVRAIEKKACKWENQSKRSISEQEKIAWETVRKRGI